MKTYRFSTVVEKDDSVHLSGLPPEQEVEIVILERTELSDEMQDWLSDIRDRHPFAQMEKEEILPALRQTRDVVWAQRHER